MNLSLSGKAALLTGASRGLGFATAQALASEGARIAINTRDQSQLSPAASYITGVLLTVDGGTYKGLV